MNNLSPEAEEVRQRCLGSLLHFTQVFYKVRTGREFRVSRPLSREAHCITISKALTKTQRGQADRLIINVPPRYGKTELCIHYIAWCLAQYPDSNFLYVSYSHTLAKKQTQTIKQIVNLPEFRELFGVKIAVDTSAKDNFETTAGGSVYAAGAAGTITGRGAGIQNCERFGGAIVIDDIHKPAEVSSDTMRVGVLDWYMNTLQSRVNSPDTPIIFCGQRLHEDDLPANLIEGYDGRVWDKVILKAIGLAGNALNPAMHTKEQLLMMKDKMPYEFASQYQQDPVPAGGGLFKRDWFVLKEETPKIMKTFITADTAETSKTYNDATVFSFWGVYKIEDVESGAETDLYGLHWIDCQECWVEPKELRNEFMSFYASCMRFEVKPKIAAIEKKSTGTTLCSVLEDVQGLQIINMERNRKAVDMGHNNHVFTKTDRFIAIQGYVGAKLISLPMFGRHTKMCLDHMVKITANDSHRYDDIADTVVDAVRLALVDKVITVEYDNSRTSEKTLATFSQSFQQRKRGRVTSWR